MLGQTARIVVLYGSQTFTAQEIAERIWRTTKILGFLGPVQAMDEYPIANLIHEEFAIFVPATTGQGDVPDNMKRFWKFLLRKNLPTNSLVKMKFGVLGLGDSSYSKFNFVGKKLHKRLMQLGATPLLEIGLCDYQHDLGHDAVMTPWLKDYVSKLKTYHPTLDTNYLADTFVPRWKVSLEKSTQENVRNGLTNDIYFNNEADCDFIDPLLFEVEHNMRTTDESHFQDVRLIKLRSTNDRNLMYNPGDIFNIRPRNSKEDIEDLFSIFEEHDIDIKPHYKLIVEQEHADMPVPKFLKQKPTLNDIAEQYWDLRCYPTQYVFSLLSHVSDDKLERDKCKELSSPEGQEDWLNYCRRPKRTILEVLHDFHRSTAKLTLPILFELFSTIKPRSFSIASSKLSCSNSLELLVAVVEYNSILKKKRLGLASNWLKSLTVGDQVYGWMKAGSLVFPKDLNIPVILIGPGTGLAPFRSYLYQRVAEGTACRNTLHLFFGCRYKDKDFHCGEELLEMERDGKLSLYCAFSRDQDRKIYVQHKITQHRATLWDLLCKNAHIYISGNAKNMPDNVKDAFVEDVICKTGGLSVEEGRLMMKEMENNGRWQVETW